MKINAILEILNEAIESKNLEISLLKYQLEDAKKEIGELNAKLIKMDAEHDAVLTEIIDRELSVEAKHKEEIKLLESRIIYLEGKLNPTKLNVDGISYEMEGAK